MKKNLLGELLNSANNEAHRLNPGDWSWVEVYQRAAEVFLEACSQDKDTLCTALSILNYAPPKKCTPTKEEWK